MALDTGAAAREDDPQDDTSILSGRLARGAIDVGPPGHVLEWCEDHYDATDYQQKVGKDPKGPRQGGPIVQRGGAWCYDGQFCRSAFRNNPAPDNRTSANGFRVTCVVHRDRCSALRSSASAPRKD